MTNKDAKRIIEENKENTAYYDGYTDFMGNTVRMTYDEMYMIFSEIVFSWEKLKHFVLFPR